MSKNTTIVLGFDFGMKYIGVACGQSITHTATPVTCIRAVDGIPDWDEIEKLIKKWRPTILVIGNPLNMDDSAQELTFCARKFANRLQQKFRLPINMVDERLSTWQAKQQMIEQEKSLTNKKISEINAESAAILVTQWLNEHPTA